MGFSIIFGDEKTDKSLVVVLVTGGTGFLGSVLIMQLLEQGIPVRATKRQRSYIPTHLRDKAALEWVDADVQDFYSLEPAFDGVKQVYHCAAKVSYDPAHHAEMRRTNIQGTAHLVNYCLERQIRLVHVSSVAALGGPKDGHPITEADLWEYGRDQSAYSVSKYESEMEVWRGIAEGLNAVIVNPSVILGRDAGRRGAGKVFYLLHEGLRFHPTGTAGYVDVEDVAQAMIHLMQQPDLRGERFIVNNVNMSHFEMLSLASRYLGKQAPTIKATRFMLEIAWRYAAFSARITGRTASLTKESVRVSCKHLRYSNEKLLEAIDMKFKPIEQTLAEICQQVLDDHK